MKANITPSRAYYTALVRKTRAFGSCYLHAGMPWQFSVDGIDFEVRPFGRSTHKSKAYAYKNGKIVPTKLLATA